MRAAVRRYANGQSTRLPYRVTRQLVARSLGQLPSVVDRMPVDDFSDALAMDGMPSLVSVVRGE